MRIADCSSIQFVVVMMPPVRPQLNGEILLFHFVSSNNRYRNSRQPNSSRFAAKFQDVCIPNRPGVLLKLCCWSLFNLTPSTEGLISRLSVSF